MDHLLTGLVNYCVPTGEAYQKALQLAREINQKVRLTYANIFLLPGADPQIWLGVGKKIGPGWCPMGIRSNLVQCTVRAVRFVSRFFAHFISTDVEAVRTNLEVDGTVTIYDWVFDQIQSDSIRFDAHWTPLSFKKNRVTRISTPSHLTHQKKKLPTPGLHWVCPHLFL